jgi:hypothetical protein
MSTLDSTPGGTTGGTTDKKYFNIVQHPNSAKIGDYATVESLLRAGGRFYVQYDMPAERERSFCDTPTGLWILFEAHHPAYQRIE